MGDVCRSNHLRAGTRQLIALLLATCLLPLAISGVAAAHSTGPRASISSVALHSAMAARKADRRALAYEAGRLSACRRTRGSWSCERQRRAVKHSRARLVGAEWRVRSLTARIARLHGRSTGAQAHKSGRAPLPSGGQHPIAPPAGSSSQTSGSSSGIESSEGSALDSGAGSGAPFEMGVIAGSALQYELPFIEKLGARTARLEFEIDTPASQMASTIEAYARAGVRPLLLASFYGTLPTPAQAQSLGSWAAQFGPGGSFWKEKSLPAGSAVTSIEFGNETSYEYQFSDDSASAYASRAQTYALRFAEAQAAIHAANSSVGLLAQGDPGNAPGTSWMDNMFKAVPNLGQIAAGWTVHPYGPNWKTIMDKVLSSAQADGAPTDIPLDVTEWGISTDNGRCLDDNYGFNKCMTYQEAATTLQSNVSAMRARYGARLASLYLFQARDQEATGAMSGREGYFGALQSDEAPKGAFTSAVESLLSTNP